MYEFDVVILEDGSGGYVGLCPCCTAAGDKETRCWNLWSWVGEAVELYLEALSG